MNAAIAEPPAPPLLQLKCENCGAHLTVAQGQKTVRCPFCALPSVVERPGEAAAQPRFVLGFKVTADEARAAIRRWIGSRGFFTQSGVRRGSIDELKGVYVPAYLYSALVRTNFTATIGEHYQETETYWDKDSQGNSVMRTRKVTKTEHRDLEGQHASYLHDTLVTASMGMPNHLLQAVEPFDYRLLRRFDPAVIAGWIAEEPSVSEEQGKALARKEIHARVEGALAGFMPGDSSTVRRFECGVERETLDLLLVPVWLLALRYHAKKPPLRLLVNGQTGKVAGHAPLSWVRIGAVVIAAIGAAVGVAYALGAFS